MRTAVLACAAVLLAACGSGRQDASTNHLGFRTGAAPTTSGLSTLQAWAVFGVIPLALLLGIAALVWLPGMMHSGRYRPATGWNARPLWFGGPPEPVAAVEAVQPDELERGGASGSW